MMTFTVAAIVWEIENAKELEPDFPLNKYRMYNVQCAREC